MSVLFPPIGIFLFGIGGGFLLPILYRFGKPALHCGFFIALAGLTLSSLSTLAAVLETGAPVDIFTAGVEPPLSINLRMGLEEGAIAVSVNVVAMLLAVSFWDRLRGSYATLLLFLILVMGINGMILTRDLFNLFVFLEIVSVGTYGLLGLATTRSGLQAAFKYVIATVIASTLFLLGTALLYHQTGQLNIDLLLASASGLAGPISAISLMMLLAGLLVELKPFPANGWGLDVYETAPPALAAMLSVCASAGMFFALAKLLPLYADQLDLIVWSAALTFVASNLIGLKQTKVQRLLGYSSVGQMALMVLALSALTHLEATALIPFVVFGLFVNHLLAKAGLFLLAGALDAANVRQELGLRRQPLLFGLLAIFVVAITALPPFPGFWAKWELILRLAEASHYPIIAAVLAGSLMEAVYMFRWFIGAIGAGRTERLHAPGVRLLAPILVLAALLVVAGCAFAVASGTDALWVLSPLIVGAGLGLLEGRLPGPVKGAAMLASVMGAVWIMPGAEGIAGLFAPLLLVGGLVIALAGLYRGDPRPWHYPLVAVLLLSIHTLLSATTALAFYVAWEFITLASFFLIAQRGPALPEVLRFLIFSLLAAFLILGGFAFIAAETGMRELAALSSAPAAALPGFILLGLGFLIKTAAVGLHVWMPGAYAEAPDDVSAMLSAVVSKVAIFGLFMATYVALKGDLGDFTHGLAWIGMATTIVGALLALNQTDVKRLLAFSSMSQLGYIITALALMSHIGWVTALYLVTNHMLVKSILFLATAGIILRTSTRSLAELGGVARAMPLTCIVIGIALLSMSGLPPLMGFGGKWLLFSAMVDKGWTGLAVAGAFATFLGLWYMARLFTALFLRPAPSTMRSPGEAPAILFAAHVVLIAGILILSLFPKLLMEPVSAAIDPVFAADLVWEGQSLETIYGLWNPAPVMGISVAAAAILFLAWRGMSRAIGQRLDTREWITTARPLPKKATPPVAEIFWRTTDRATHRLAAIAQQIYTGDGQTYVLWVLVYFLVLTFASTFWGA